MDEQQRTDRQKEAVEAFLKRRNRTVYSMSSELELDRNTFTKFAKGRRVSLPWLEKFTRAAGEDLEQWKRHTGVTADTPDLQWNRWLADQLRALVDEFPGVAALPMPVECVAAFGGLAEPLTEEDAREIYDGTRAVFVEVWEEQHGPRG